VILYAAFFLLIKIQQNFWPAQKLIHRVSKFNLLYTLILKGDFQSFVTRMKKKATQKGVDLLIVDSVSLKDYLHPTKRWKKNLEKIK
jgi:hypothetical protein